MWVMTENGDLVNLDQVKRIGIPWRPDLDRNPRTEVKAWEAHYDAFGVTLCTCDDEEHGKRIIARLFTAIRSGVPAIEMCDVKREENPFKTTLWRPFDTAPKDGRWFLAYRMHDAYMCIARNEGVFVLTSEGPKGHWHDACFNSLDDDLPTHWMPLPEPPEDGEAS